MRYRSKPSEVTAVRWTGDNLGQMRDFVGMMTFPTSEGYEDRPGFVRAFPMHEDGPTAAVYDYLHESWINVYTGQWIIRGMKGEHYPCADDVFRAKYEEIA